MSLVLLHLFLQYIWCHQNRRLHDEHLDDQRPKAVSVRSEFLQWTSQQVLGLCFCPQQGTWTRWDYTWISPISVLWVKMKRCSKRFLRKAVENLNQHLNKPFCEYLLDVCSVCVWTEKKMFALSPGCVNRRGKSGLDRSPQHSAIVVYSIRSWWGRKECEKAGHL